ncbi:MAG: hypothetical protein JXA07_15230 [Spirochaetes bacterium]|nr:hypothetical protein [Spirochaetota bacterium]
MDRVIHRFHSTTPVSPSGRYVGLTRLHDENCTPLPGDVSEIIVVDMDTGACMAVAETRGADTQMGAHVQWGMDDSQLCYNDVDTETWNPFGIIINPFTGGKKILEGTIYTVSPDGKFAASPCLKRTGITQAGYGVIVPRENIRFNNGAADDDGVYITDSSTGEKNLWHLLKKLLEMPG